MRRFRFRSAQELLVSVFLDLAKSKPKLLASILARPGNRVSNSNLEVEARFSGSGWQKRLLTH